MSDKNKYVKTLIFAIAFAIGSVLISLNLGQVKFNFFLEYLKGRTGILSIIILLRQYRVLSGFMTGASLALSGIIFQALLKNPLAEPFILGVSSGSALGAAISLFLFGSSTIIGIGIMNIFALCGAFLACFIVFSLSKVRGNISITVLLLAGVVTSSMLASLLMFIITLVPGRIVHGVMWWLLGDLQILDVTSLVILSLTCCTGILASLFLCRDLNALILGDDTAHHLGINVNKVRIILFIIASILAAIAVSSCGIIGFVGLIIPHFCRMITGADHRKLIPVSILIGGGFLVLADGIARSVVSGYEIPIGVITSLIGGPLFLIVMRRKDSKNE